MEDNLLLLGTRKGLVVYQKSAMGQWHHTDTHFLGTPVTIATIDPHTATWWALIDHGHWGCKVHRSQNGKDWEELEAPKYPEGEMVKEGMPASTKYLWAFASGGMHAPGTIYIGTEPGGLFKSTNNGDSFELVRGLWEHESRPDHWFGGGRDEAGIHSIWVNPKDANHLQVGVSVAGTFETTDGGSTWVPLNKGLKADFLPDPSIEVGHDPHLLDWCAANPQVMWQQNHCGIFRSVDGGNNWTDISEPDGPANFGFAVAAHATNPEVAWVVPGTSDMVRIAVDQKLCVCRTNDGGKTWKAFRKGLPQESCFDIVYRHALALSGDTLAFGTTTGNLFLSNDGGESWDALSHYLPMIHSVEFASV